jgi:hypothetical protein
LLRSFARVHFTFGSGIPIIAPSPKFLLSLHDVHAPNAHLYPADTLENVQKRNPTGIYHHSANNVGCVDEDVHLEPCCVLSNPAPASPSSHNNASFSRQHSSCADLRASRFSPEACSRDSLLEWLPRIHTAVYPHVQQFDSLEELLELLTDLASSDDLNLKIRQAMRQLTLQLALHNSGK